MAIIQHLTFLISFLTQAYAFTWEFLRKGPKDDQSLLIQVMAWHQTELTYDCKNITSLWSSR